MHAKIIIRYYNDDSPNDIKEEGVWGTRISESLYKLDNIPFFARSLSLDDIVEVVKIESELYASELKEGSGNSTIRIVFDDKGILDKIRGELFQKGCSSEYDNIHNLIAVNIPKEVDYFEQIQPYLEKGLTAGIWDYEEACIAHIDNGQRYEPKR